MIDEVAMKDLCEYFPKVHKPRSVYIFHLALASQFTVLSQFRIKVPPNNCQSDWPDDHIASDVF